MLRDFIDFVEERKNIGEKKLVLELFYIFYIY